MRTKHTVPARQRLLEAAERVFARDGLEGATTREIAREAQVSEITLFRHFGCKDKLVGEVVGRVFPSCGRGAAQIACTDNLRADLEDYARLYAKRMQDNMGLVRTLIGEIHHNHLIHEREVFVGIFRPLRTALAARLEKAVQDGDLSSTAGTIVLADLFNSMIFTDVIRRSASQVKLEYSFEDTIKAAVDLFIPAKAGRKTRK